MGLRVTLGDLWAVGCGWGQSSVWCAGSGRHMAGVVVSVVHRWRHAAGVASGRQCVREQEQVGVRAKQGVGVATSHTLNTSEVGQRG